MSDIEELQRRITTALDKIGQDLEGLNAESGTGSSELEAATQALEDEKLANAQLEERLKSVQNKRAAERQAAEKAEEERAQAMSKLDSELQSLRKANEQLRENNKALREANEAGVAEPHLINKAMLAELEGLRATRAADKAEIEAVMADLSRAVENAADGSNTKAENA